MKNKFFTRRKIKQIKKKLFSAQNPKLDNTYETTIFGCSDLSVYKTTHGGIHVTIIKDGIFFPKYTIKVQSGYEQQLLKSLNL